MIDQIKILQNNLTLPQSFELDPPDSWDESLPYFESLEGMLVGLKGPAIAVSPITKYGEYVLVHPRHDLTRLFQGEDNGMMIMVDDGSYTTHMDNSTLPYLINTGDTVSDLAGPLAFTYGRYKVEPISAPEIIAQERQIPNIPPPEEDKYSVMSWNVENLFDVLDPHPSSPPRPKLAEYKRDIEKVANTIVAAGYPVIVALQEVENIGILEDIANHQILAEFSYQPVLIEGFDSRGIDVGYLVRRDLAEILDVQQMPGPNGLTSRPPLVLHVLIKTNSGQTDLYVINNHFTSMSAGVEATEPVRIAQAEWNGEIVQMIMNNEPDARIAVVGDLNSFLNSKPIQALINDGLAHVFDMLPKNEQYTYIYQGESQVLDHIIVNPSLNELLDTVAILRLNADYSLPASDDLSAFGKSDHDPVVATFKIK